MILLAIFLLAQATDGGFDPSAEAADAGVASAPPVGAALLPALKAIKQDGPVALTDAAQAEIVSVLPAARKGEECPEPARIAGEPQGLKDRGEGALIVAELSTCRGGRIFAFSTGNPPRVARLLEIPEGIALHGARALSLHGGKRENDLAIELQSTATLTELRLLGRRDSGFGFSESGVFHEWTGARECNGGADEGSGWASFIKGDKDRLAVLRVDSSCTGGPWQASCQLWKVEGDGVARAGACPLPAKLDARSLKASGWK